MAKYDMEGYILIHRDKVERLNYWGGTFKKRSLFRRLINYLTGRSPYSY